MQLVLQALNIDLAQLTDFLRTCEPAMKLVEGATDTSLLFIANPDNTKKAQVFKEGIDYSVISSMCVCMCVCVWERERECVREWKINNNL